MFEDEEENKFIYTNAFNAYTKEIEALISMRLQECLPGFQMCEFVVLMKYIFIDSEIDLNLMMEMYLNY